MTSEANRKQSGGSRGGRSAIVGEFSASVTAAERSFLGREHKAHRGMIVRPWAA